MSILSDGDIEDFIANKKLGITPFESQNLTPNGYDLTIEEILIKSTDTHITDGIASIPARSWFLVSTKEYIEMGNDVASQLWLRSSYARKGIFASFGKVDAGFHGTLTISCFNASDTSVDIPIGDRLCQIVFEKMLTEPKALYSQRSGTYHQQRGITQSR